MNNYTIFYKDSGQISRNVSISDNMPQYMFNIDIEDYILGHYDPKLYYVDTSITQPVLFPPKPYPYYQFNFTTKQWEDPRSLEEIKLQRWAYIKTKREADNIKPLLTTHGTFDADYKSQKGITDAIMLLQTLASLGTPTSIDFTLADNTTTTLTTPQMIEVGLTLGSRTQQLFSKARGLRDSINSANTKEEVEAIEW